MASEIPIGGEFVCTDAKPVVLEDNHQTSEKDTLVALDDSHQTSEKTILEELVFDDNHKISEPLIYVKFISLDGKFLRYSLDHLKSKRHLNRTIIGMTFFSGNFAEETEMELDCTFDVMKLLVPLIRENHLMIPNKKLMIEFRKLVDYLAGESETWEHYSNLLQFQIYDIIGRFYDLSNPMFEGKYFTETGASFFTANINTIPNDFSENCPSNIKIRHCSGSRSHSIY